MIKKLKQILDTYTDEELDKMALWIDCDVEPELVIIEPNSDGDNIVLITDKEKVKVDDMQY